MIGRGAHGDGDLFELLQLLLQRRDLVFEPDGFGLRNFALLPVGGLKGRQIAIDAGFDLRHPPLDLIGGEVLVAVVNRLELAAVNRDEGFRK